MSVLNADVEKMNTVREMTASRKIGLMTAASFLNLLLSGVWKYAALVLVLALACALFHAELRTLWTTAGQVLSALRGHFRKEERHGR